MYSTDYLTDLINKECDLIEYEKQPANLFEPISYIMKIGGKRTRPLLSLLSANIFSDDINPAIDVALAVEILHNFTLLHDDLMDNAPMRRGKATVHTRWNSNVAILSGDAMVPIAYSILCRKSDPDKIPSLVNEFCKAAIDVVKGQQFDMDYQSKSNITIDEYVSMIHLKTATLLASAMKLGAISVAASEQQQEAIYNFGINIGLAFQIKDDLLDTYGDCKTFGKTIGGDIAEGKQTFLMVTARQMANEHQTTILNSSRSYLEVKEIYDALGVESIAQETIENYYGIAMNFLKAAHTDSTRLSNMEQYANQLLHRSR